MSDRGLPAWEVRESRRARRMRLRVREDGRVEVTLPAGGDHRQAAAFVRAKRDWIQRVQADQEARRQSWPAAERGPWPTRLRLAAIGEAWPVAYRDAPAGCRASGGQLQVGATGEAEAHAALERWVGRRARAVLEPWLQIRAEEMGVTVTGVTIRGQRTRWGSCSAGGRVNLNRRLLFLEPVLVEYVLVHELCHRRHLNHGPAFRRLLTRHLPDAAERERALRSPAGQVPPWLPA
ncbi:MAG: M48 family metallopeptidase [Thiohalospira sp.]